MLKIAWRNILRNKRRSFLSLLIIVIGVMMLFLFRSYSVATFQGLKMMSISRNGHLQIAGKGFWNGGNERRLLGREEMKTIENTLSEKEEIKEYTTELKVSGILGTEKGSTIVSGLGVKPGNSINQNIMIKEGTNLFAGDVNRVILGQGVMETLKLDVNEWVSIMATSLHGAYNAASLQVSGSFSMGNTEADAHYIIMPLSFAQNLLGTEGVDKYIVVLKDTKVTDQVIDSLRDRFRVEGLELEIKSWLDLATMYHQVKALYDTIFFFISVVIFILVFFSILEIMSMAFFERMREIGTIRAIGTLRSQIFKQLFAEAMILGIIGGVTGILLGWITANLLNGVNITYNPPNMSTAVPLYFDLILKNGLYPFAIVMISTCFSVLYPAFKASRINVVEMLRYN